MTLNEMHLDAYRSRNWSLESISLWRLPGNLKVVGSSETLINLIQGENREACEKEDWQVLLVFGWKHLIWQHNLRRCHRQESMACKIINIFSIWSYYRLFSLINFWDHLTSFRQIRIIKKGDKYNTWSFLRFSVTNKSNFVPEINSISTYEMVTTNVFAKSTFIKTCSCLNFFLKKSLHKFFIMLVLSRKCWSKDQPSNINWVKYSAVFDENMPDKF